MKVSVISATELDGTLACRWRRIQEADSHLASPFFCPEFTLAAAEFYPNTYVGVIEEGTSVAGFLPFERQWGKAGRAVALGLSDYQGAIIGQEVEWSVPDLLRGCMLSSLEFDYLIASQTPFQKYHTRVTQAHIVDLQAGYEHYRDKRNHHLHELKKVRHLERDFGPVRLEVGSHDSSILRTLIELKRQQYARTGIPDALQRASVRRFLERIHGTQSNGFAGLLATLYAGDTLVAAHFGMRSKTVWHSWFPAHVPSFHKYSPGLLLMEEMCRAAGTLGLGIVDLGYGDEPYKLRFANGTIAVASARAGLSLPSLVRHRVGGLKRRLTGTRLEKPALTAYCAAKRVLDPWFASETAGEDK